MGQLMNGDMSSAIVEQDGAYKLTNTCRIEGFFEGKLWFGSLAYYQLLEHVTRDQWRGDMYDGLSPTLFKTPDPADPATKEAINNHGVGFDNTTTNLTLITRTEGFAFCFSQGQASKIWSDNQEQFGADNLLQIKNINALASAIEQHGTFRGHRIKDIVDVAHGPIVYGREEIFDGEANKQVKSDDPFSKRKLYRKQAEYRILLRCRGRQEELPDGILVEIPKSLAQELFEQCTLPYPPRPATIINHNITDFSGAIACLFAIMDTDQNVKASYGEGNAHMHADSLDDYLEKSSAAISDDVFNLTQFYWSKRTEDYAKYRSPEIDGDLLYQRGSRIVRRSLERWMEQLGVLPFLWQKTTDRTLLTKAKL